jgi:hypothetical protein
VAGASDGYVDAEDDDGGSADIDHTNPTFLIDGTVSLIENDVADKVGMTTGWRWDG